MNFVEAVFWAACFCVGYTYLVYPLIMLVWARWLPRETHRDQCVPNAVSIVIAAHNEERRIAQRVDELLALLAGSRAEGEIIVVSDGSSDGTAAAVRQLNQPRARLIEQTTNTGKANALNAGCAAASGEVVFFADARQRWSVGVIDRMLEKFSDPAVGAVSGELVISNSSGVLAGVGLYWRYEKWIRRQESRVHSSLGVTGAICAVRRKLFCPIPHGTILDDVFWPLRVVLQGYRVIHDERSEALDCLPERVHDEFRRKVRTLSGNFQLIQRMPILLMPWRNPLWFQFMSHKVLRLVVPWALILAFVTSLMLEGSLYRVSFGLQALLYTVGLLGLIAPRHLQQRVPVVIASFLMLNAAAWLSFWVWVLGRSEQSWTKAVYITSTDDSRRRVNPTFPFSNEPSSGKATGGSAG